MQRETFFTPLEYKFAADGEAMTFAGYGAYFNNVDAYGDVIVPGAFAETLKKARESGNWPAMLLQHGGGMLGGGDDAMPVGVWTDMREDEKGLWVEGKLADTQRGRDTYALLKMTPRPAITGLSIGYRAIEWTMRAKPEDPRRTLKKVELLEVSLVTFPANERARVQSVKSLDELTVSEIRELEAALREKGLSRADAVKAISGLKEFFRRDAGDTDETGAREELSAEELALAMMLRRNANCLKEASHGF